MSWMQLHGWEAATEVLAVMVRYLLVGLVVAGMVGCGGLLAYRICQQGLSGAAGGVRHQKRRRRGQPLTSSAIDAEVARGVADIERYLARCARSRRREP
jgi:hypothetical protein